MRTHGGGDAVPALEQRQARERKSHSLQRQGEREYAAAVDRAADLVLVDVRGLCVDGEHLALNAVTFQPVALAPPAVGAAEGKHAGVLTGAVVPERRGRVPRWPALELALGRRRLCEQRAHGRELLLVREMRGRGDREVPI